MVEQRPTKDLIVVGHGRGATSFMAAWLQKNGIQVRHEAMGPQGIVDSLLSVPGGHIRNGMSRGQTRNDFNFNIKACVLRNPYKVIATYFGAEVPTAILNHQPYLPALLEGLTPPGWFAASNEEKLGMFTVMDDFRINAIARSVVRWTTLGMNYADYRFRVEDELGDFAAHLVLACLIGDLDMVEDLPPNKINHKHGPRLSRSDIDAALKPQVADELAAYMETTGYE